MNDTLALIIKVDLQNSSQHRQWEVFRIFKKSSTEILKKKMGHVRPVPRDPVNPQYFPDTYMNDHDNRALGVIRFAGADANGKPELMSLHCFSKTDMALIVTCLFACQLMRDVTQEQIDAFNSAGCVGTGAD